MRALRIISILAVFAITMIGCENVKVENNTTSVGNKTEVVAQGIQYKTISPKEAKKRLEAEKGIVLLDVRTPAEYAQKHIPKSTLIPVDMLQNKVQSQISNKETTIFIYCRSGNRSRMGAKMLIDLDYKNVYDLGGIINWPYDVE